MGAGLTSKIAVLALCVAGAVGCGLAARAAEEPPHPQAIDDAIIAAAKRHGVPEHLIRRIIMRESKYNAAARNRLYWGLMQISYPTAKSMGFKGTPQQLLNPFVNLRYAVPYLANAYKIAGKTEDAAVRLYAAGYYFTAKSRGMLGDLRTADSAPLAPEPSETPMLAANAVAQPPQSVGVFGALFGPGSQPQPQPQPAAYVAQAQPGADPQQASAGPAGSAPQVAAQTAAAAPPGTFDGKTVEMSPNKAGEMAPPKKWAHDGGVTLMARGEQGLDQVASRDRQPEDEPRHASRRHHKNTNFAALDLAPTTAQAYANQPAGDPRFAASASQEAISQATVGQPPQGTAAPVAIPGQVAADGSQPAPGVAPVQAADATPAAEEVPTKKRVRRHVARHRKASEARTQQASAEKAQPEAAASPAAPNPAPQPVQ